jgi:imidazole glycerol-phosphate synthase subunit HisH
MTIAIVKYGMGNVASVQKALKKLDYNSIITDDHNAIKEADFIILPGVGSFKKGMENLRKYNLIKLLTQEVIEKRKPFLGICLGMQLLATYGTEPEKVDGLGWVDGEVVKVESLKGLRVPHLGWNSIKIKNDKTGFYTNFNNQDFYFIHSYHFNVLNQDEITYTVNYDYEIVAAIQKDNIYAMQFHPEKSQKAGMSLLKKVLEQYA